MNILKDMKFIEVCAGAGGMSLGFMKCDMKPVLLIDTDKDSCKTLKRNHANVNVQCVDMKVIDLSEYRNTIDVLCGGIPCQSWSQAGNREGVDDSRGHLVYTFRDLVKTILPKVFVIENVKGMTTLNGGEAFREILDILTCDDMYSVKYQVLNANDYGVAQKRERLFIIGVLKELHLEYSFPEKLGSTPVLRDVLMDVPESVGAEYSDKKKEIFKLVPEGGCWVDLPEDIQREYMGKSFFSGGGKRGIAKRLSMSQPSLTLLCSPQQKQTERCHPTELRPLNVREYARIQSFPDDFVFEGSINSQYKQIGNAVPVELAYHVGKNIVKMLLK
jgi:DNA (cytosine-5)-methyltransferase 1